MRLVKSIINSFMDWEEEESTFSKEDIKGYARAFEISYSNLVDDLIEVQFDRFLEDYIKSKSLVLDPGTKVILSMWIKDDRLVIRFIPASEDETKVDEIRFARGKEIFTAATESTDLYIKLQDLEDFYNDIWKKKKRG